MNTFISTKKSYLYIVGRPVRDAQVTTHLQLAQHWNISTKLWQNILFYQQSQPLYDVMQKEIDNLNFIQGAIVNI